jgi:hypothetical protein
MGRRNQGRTCGPVDPQWAGTGFPDDAVAPEPMSLEQQLGVLKEQATHVEGVLKDIHARIEAFDVDAQDD